LDRGLAESFPWGRGQKEAEDTFRTIQDVLTCADKRLVTHAKRTGNDKRSLDLQDQKLAICHGDLNPRNILILTDGQVALLDWEWMCMYPVVFDLACLSMLQVEEPHEKQAWLIEVLKSDVCLELKKTREDVEDVLLSLRLVDRESLRWCY
jgi:thiamine kinase-like enzyme